jgi:hypothetical protein
MVLATRATLTVRLWLDRSGRYPSQVDLSRTVKVDAADVVHLSELDQRACLESVLVSLTDGASDSSSRRYRFIIELLSIDVLA